MKIYLMTLAVCLQTNFSIAQEKKATSDTLRNIELPAAVIKETRRPLLNDKAAGVMQLKNPASFVSRQHSMEDLPYLLNQTASVVVTSDAGTGTGYTGIRIRGADLTRINVTMNGVPVNDAESQATYFVDMPDIFSSTKEVTINKGVGSSSNGVGSFGASIGINNLDIDDINPSYSFRSDYGSFNTFKVMSKASTGLINSKFVTTLRLSSILSDGYIQRSASNLKGLQITSKYIFNQSTQLVFNYMKGKERTGQAWNGVSQDSLKLNRTFNELGIKSDGTFYNNQTDNYGQDYYQLFFDKKLNSKVSLGSTLFYTKGKGYYEEYKIQQSYNNYHLPDVVIGNDTIRTTDLIRQLWLDNDFYGGRLYLNYLSGKTDAGIYFNLNQYRGRHHGEVVWAEQHIPDHYRWYSLYAEKNDLNVYAMLDHRFTEKVSILADMQIRDVNYTIDGFRNNPDIKHDLHYFFFNPKVKATYKTDKQIASIVAGVAQKEPNREDVEAGTMYLPKAEKLMNLELNYARLFGRRFVLYTTVYYMKYKDQLVPTGRINDVGAYTRSNVPHSYRAGLEIESKWRPACKIIQAGFSVALSQNKINEFTEYIDDYDQGGQWYRTLQNTDIAFSPSLIASGQLSVFPFRSKSNHLFENFSIDLSAKYVGKQFLDNTGNNNRKLNAYFLSDLLCTMPFEIKHRGNFQLKAGVYNVFDKMYESNGYTFSYILSQSVVTQNYYFPQAGRRWVLGIGIDL